MKIKDITPFTNGASICSTPYIKNRNLNRTLKKVFEKFYRIKRNAKSKTIANFLSNDEVTPYQNAALLYNPDKDTKLTSIFNFMTHKIKITVNSDRSTSSLEAIWKVEMIFNNHEDVFGWEEVYTDIVTLLSGGTDTHFKVKSVVELQNLLNKYYRHSAIRLHKCLHKVDRVTKHKHRKGKHRKFRDLSISPYGRMV